MKKGIGSFGDGCDRWCNDDERAGAGARDRSWPGFRSGCRRARRRALLGGVWRLRSILRARLLSGLLWSALRATTLPDPMPIIAGPYYRHHYYRHYW